MKIPSSDFWITAGVWFIMFAFFVGIVLDVGPLP